MLLCIWVSAGLAGTASSVAPPTGWEARKGDIAFFVIPSVHVWPASSSSPEYERLYRNRLDKILSRSRSIYFERVAEGYHRSIASGFTPGANESSISNSNKSGGVTKGDEDWLHGINRSIQRASRVSLGGAIGGTEIEIRKLNMQYNLPERGLESPGSIFAAFASLPPQSKQLLVAESVLTDEAYAKSLQPMVAAIAGGDFVGMCRLAESSVKRDLHYYSKIVIARNARWTSTIERSGSAINGALVVVGAAHLCGDRSFIEKLARNGYSLTQF